MDRRLGASHTPHFLAMLAVAAGLTALSVVVATSIGPADLSFGRVVGLLLGGTDEASIRAIVIDVRLPRIIGAVVVGGGLGIVGATLQSVMRNPLADPYILGVSSGASVGAAFAALLGMWGGSGLWMSLFAFASALVTVMVVFRIAAFGREVSPLRLLLAGVAMSSFTMALTALILYLAQDALSTRGLIFWLMGGLQGAEWTALIALVGLTIPPCVFLFATARSQNVLLMGDDAATALGLEVARTRRLLVLLSAWVTGACVAFSGAIGFVGLIVPHMLRPWLGPNLFRILPASALVGGLLLLWMDTAARSILPPHEIPVGILTGLLGAPFFLFLLKKAGGEFGGH